MYRENQTRQKSIFGSEVFLSESLKKQLLESWAHSFREEVFGRIDESQFASLYSEVKSRPNTPVNILMGAEILKAGWGWSDEELYEAVCFDLRVRYALGVEDLGGEAPFQLRTLYNFRQRVRKYAEEAGENMYQRVFAQITDEQLQAFGVKTGKQRMDSTQVLSNLADGGRLELLISVLQQVVKGVATEKQSYWEREADAYLGKRPHEIGYGIRSGEVTGHLQQLGALLMGMLPDLERGSEAEFLAERVLREQYEQQEEGLILRAAAEIGADSLQSPHDTEATYREKNGERYRGGYVVNASETCDNENALQLVTDIQVASNVTDDGELLKASLENQSERGLEVKEITTDGGYTGPNSETYCKEHGIELRPTNVRGGKSKAGNMAWEDYEWRLDAEGQPAKVVCPQGKVGTLEPGTKPERLTARFDDADTCLQCPLLDICRVKVKKRRGPTFYVTRRSIQVAQMRQRLRPEDLAIRAPIEATMRSLTWRLRQDKVAYRSLLPTFMHFCGVAIMVNLRRIHAYLSENNLASTHFYPFWLKWGRLRLFTDVSAVLQTLRAAFQLSRSVNPRFSSSLSYSS